MRAGMPQRALLTLTLSVLLIASCAAPSGSRSAPRRIATEFTLAVMGASDAWGIGTRDPDRLNWPTFLAADLQQVTRLINLGVPGSTLAQAIREQLPVVIGERPDALVIWLAVNDIIDGVPLATYAGQLRQTLAAVGNQSPRTRVFVGDVPDLTQLPYFAGWDQERLRQEVSAWNAAIAAACAGAGATLVDLYSVWGQMAAHPDYVSDDGLHPSTRGADALALVFAVAIEQRLHASH